MSSHEGLWPLTHKLSLHLKTSQLPDFIGKSAFFFGKTVFLPQR